MLNSSQQIHEWRAKREELRLLLIIEWRARSEELVNSSFLNSSLFIWGITFQKALTLVENCRFSIWINLNKSEFHAVVWISLNKAEFCLNKSELFWISLNILTNVEILKNLKKSEEIWIWIRPFCLNYSDLFRPI